MLRITGVCRCAYSSKGGPGHPRVLADRQPELGAGEPDRAGRFAGRERARLVEHAVVRELDLVVASDDLPAADERGGVVDPPLGAVDEADHDRAAAGRVRGERVQRDQVVVDERRPEDEVLGRVAGDRELGEHDDVGVRLRRSGRPGRQEVDVAGQIADRRIDLSECDPHARQRRRLRAELLDPADVEVVRLPDEIGSELPMANDLAEQALQVVPGLIQRPCRSDRRRLQLREQRLRSVAQDGMLLAQPVDLRRQVRRLGRDLVVQPLRIAP